MCNECSICYESDPRCKLVCGHAFHHSCIKEWFMQGQKKGCPMCRKNIYFKGMRKYKNKWERERWEKQCNDVYSEAMSGLFAEAKESPFINLIFKQALEDLEEDYILFKGIVNNPDDLRYLLYNPNEYYDQEAEIKKVQIYHETANTRKRSKLFKQPKQKIHYQRKR